MPPNISSFNTKLSWRKKQSSAAALKTPSFWETECMSLQDTLAIAITAKQSEQSRPLSKSDRCGPVNYMCCIDRVNASGRAKGRWRKGDGMPQAVWGREVLKKVEWDEEEKKCYRALVSIWYLPGRSSINTLAKPHVHTHYTPCCQAACLFEALLTCALFSCREETVSRGRIRHGYRPFSALNQASVDLWQQSTNL